MNTLTAQQTQTSAAFGDRLTNIVTITYHIDALTPYFKVQAADLDTGVTYGVDEGTAPGLVGVDKSLQWPINDPLAVQVVMPNRVFRLQLQLIATIFPGVTQIVATMNMIPIQLVPPMQIVVTFPGGMVASGAVVTLTPKDPKLAFTSKISVTYNTDANGIVTIQLSGTVQQLKDKGALITVYIPQSNYFAYIDNAQVSAGIVYNIPLTLQDPNNPPVFRVTVVSANAITATLTQLLGIIGTPSGFTRVNSQIVGNNFIIDIQPNMMSPTFAWGALITFVIVIAGIAIVFAIGGWFFQQVAGVGASVGGQVFLAGLGIAIAGVAGYYLLSPSFRSKAGSALSKGVSYGRSVRKRLPR